MWVGVLRGGTVLSCFQVIGATDFLWKSLYNMTVNKFCMVNFVQEMFINKKKPIPIILLEIVGLEQQLTLPDIPGIVCLLLHVLGADFGINQSPSRLEL